MQARYHFYCHNTLPMFLFVVSVLAFLPLNSGQLSQVVGDDQVGAAAELPRVYIVHVRKPERMLSACREEVEEWHKSFLPSPTLDSGKPRMVFSYKVVISGFAARLTASEVRAMESKEDFLGAQPDCEVVHQTTYSSSFLGLRGKVWKEANSGKDAIIGVVDGGISPDHASFRGKPVSTVPAGWHGFCAFNNKSTCNDKLLGAKHPISQTVTLPPIEGSGHGTHVAGTAAGLDVAGASINGLAKGAAAGAAPAAYLAMYKAKTEAETLWSLEKAINDGVHTLSISMNKRRDNPKVPIPFHQDALAIGTLAAVRRGILVSCSACNTGPDPGSVCNDAPWIMTVGASTMDRVFSFELKLGNGDVIPGQSVYTKPGLSRELVYPGLVNRATETKACSNLGGVNVAGKVVMCITGSNEAEVKANVIRQAGGVAMVVMNTERAGSIITDIPDIPGVPTVAVTKAHALRLVRYLNTTKGPHRVEFVPKATSFNVAPFPAVPGFSSRGPSLANGGILKPDILGPGVNILAAKANTSSEFVLKSGTSMAAPHLSGIAAILQRYQRAKTGSDWTPAMIRSAIMTTAETTNRQGRPITDQTEGTAGLFATGAGHVNPAAALDPGLVYDLHADDHIRYLCGLGYTDVQVTKTAGMNVKCAQFGKIDPEQLNYPSISVTLKTSTRKTIKRTVIAVGPVRPSYKYQLSTASPWPGVKIQVSPETLGFTARDKTKSFEVTFIAESTAKVGEVFQGLLKWVTTDRVVTSPVVVTIK